MVSVQHSARLAGTRDRTLAGFVGNAYNVGMATLNIRKLPDEVHRELRLRAARHNRSMEAEARAILGEVCKPRRPVEEVVREVQAWVDEAYGSNKPKGVVDEFLRWRRTEAWRD
jgi:plasmid stability protein